MNVTCSGIGEAVTLCAAAWPIESGVYGALVVAYSVSGCAAVWVERNVVIVLHRLFFFFQAEDGIRDYKVTGVQTCALPIWRRGALRTSPWPRRCGRAPRRRRRGCGRAARRRPGRRGRAATARRCARRRRRSEERRVGEEGRSRWSPYH